MNQSDNKTPHKAKNYDKNVRKTIPFYDLFHKETIDLVKNIKSMVDVWLDTGCGTGTLVKEALHYFPNTVFILADPSKDMLDQAGEKLRTTSSQIRFLDPVETEGIILDDTNRPQVITSIQSHHYMDANGRRNATQKCYDLIAPDGLYITFENIRPDSEKGVKIAIDRWMNFQLSQGRDEETVKQHRQRYNTSYFPITIDEHITLLKECGFRVAELFWYSHMQAGFYAIK